MTFLGWSVTDQYSRAQRGLEEGRICSNDTWAWTVTNKTFTLRLKFSLTWNLSNSAKAFFYYYLHFSSKLQKGDILVSRILDISGRKSGHFQIIAANLSIFGIKRLQYCWFMSQFNSKWKKLRRKHAFVLFHASYLGKIQQIQDSDIFWLKIRIPDRKSLFATLLKVVSC